MYPYYDSFMGWGFGWGGMILMILFWALIIWLIVALIRRATWRGRYHNNDRDREYDDRRENEPLRILKERYAKGEINRTEYELKKKDLET